MAYLSTKDMETYAENTFSSLLYLTLEATGMSKKNIPNHIFNSNYCLPEWTRC